MQETPQPTGSEPLASHPTATLVIGHSVTIAAASPSRRLASFVTDSSITLAAWTAALPWVQAPLQHPWVHLSGALTLAAAIRWIQRRTLDSTLGDRLWGLRSEALPSGRRALRQASLPGGTQLARGFFTALTVLGLPTSSLIYLKHSHASLMDGALETFAVAPPPSSADWPNLPLFYLLGPWPAKVDGQPVTYSLPYSKGPPQKFLGAIVAQWKGKHEATLQFEGPRTPQSPVKPAELRNCFTPGWQQRNPIACLGVREQALQHSRESLRLRFNIQDPQSIKIGWFETHEDPDAIRGIHLRAESSTLIEDHYVTITAGGTHQTIRLTRPATPQALETESLFLAALSSQRAEKEISQSRAWADQLLASVELSSLQSLENNPSAWASRAAEIEAFLVAKLSVDPTAIEPFFHLGGIATLFARQGARIKNPEWTEHSSSLLQAVIRYAHDVAPKDERVSHLEKIQGELQAPGDHVAPRASPIR